MKKNYLLTVIWMVCALVAAAPRAYGQTPNVFSENYDSFLKELKDYVTASKQKQAEEAFANFERKFRGSFSETNMKRIVATCNKMLSYKMYATPFFSDYLVCVYETEAVDGKSNSFGAWNTIVDSLLNKMSNRRNDEVRQFLYFSTYFLGYNALNYGESSVNWVASSRQYTLRYDKGTPSVEWSKTNLSGRYKADSIEIIDTEGAFFPLSNQWIGKKGRVTWERFNDKATYCELGNYNIDVKKGLYAAEKATLYYPSMFPKQSIEGSFEDKINSGNTGENSYPRFTSFERRLKIGNIGMNIQYEGGFKLQGKTVYGFGSRDERARLTVNDSKTGRRNFRSAAEQYVIRQGENIIADKVEVAVYFGADSIYHPSVNLKMDIAKRILRLERGQRGSERNPFFNSYHKTSMDIERLEWLLDKDSILLGTSESRFGNAKTSGMFESLSYYSETDFRKYQNISTRNSLSIIALYAEEQKRRSFSADEIARQLNPKMDGGMIQSLLFELVEKGFISYDTEKQIVDLKDKLFHYVAANRKETDYDVLRMQSETRDANGAFSLRDTAITVNGAKGIELSAKQRVGVIPSEAGLKLKKNRDFDFDGKIYAGFAIFSGAKNQFDYNQFEIKMDSARYLDLYLKKGIDQYNRPTAVAINSRIEHLKGLLRIDDPNNKSGRQDMKEFPMFISKEHSFVFYDDPSIQEADYKREDFYFKLDKFNLVGLDSLTRNDLKFNGLMRAADIFPDFRETLVLQPDSSLGFVNRTPQTGYVAYKGKGLFSGDVILNNKGFLGNGTLKYLDASIDSKDIIFRPQLLIASANTFELKENRATNVPQVIGPGVQINWRPYVDSMYMTTKDSAFRFFPEGSFTLRNTIILTPDGVKGKDIFEWDKGTLRSQLFSFGSHSVSADTMNMSIRALDQSSSELAFDTKNIRGKIDFDTQKGRFKANSDDVQTSMPGVKYKTSINEFEWNLKSQDIDFKSDGRKATFLCIDVAQDSLQFTGTKASYDLKTNVLKVGGVPFVKTCDAFVYPSGDNIQVELGGRMTTIENAKIECDTLTKYHVINRATVNIKGRKEYTASGYYQYNMGNRKQEIRFDNIIGDRVGKGQRWEKRTETRATGEVSVADTFYVDLKTVFKGRISLYSNSKDLRFDGYAKFELENLPEKEWFSISSAADKNDLALSYAYPKNEAGENLYTGIYISKENAQAYPRAMMGLMYRKDRQVIDVKGVFKYNGRSDELVFGDSAKILAAAPRGNRFLFNNRNSTVSAEGRLQLGSGLQYVNLVSAGRARTLFLPPDQQSDSTGIKGSALNLEVMAGLDMLIPEKLIKIMVADIQSNSFDAPETDYKKDDFAEKALAEFILDAKDYAKIISEMKDRTLELPAKYNKFNVFFSRMPMKWSPDLQSFISTSKRIDINSIGGTPINKALTAAVEVRMPSNEDDRVYVHLRSGNDFFYFFGYQKGILSISSNNPRMEEEFNKIKPKERIIKMSDNQPFEIQWVENSTAELFARRVQAAQAR